MRDEDKTRGQLLQELASMRQQVAALRELEDEHRRTEEALRESEGRFRSIYMQSPIGVELYDAQGRLVDVNPACLRIFGVDSVEEVRGFKLFADPNVPVGARARLGRGEAVAFQSSFSFELVKRNRLYRTSKSGDMFIDCLITPLQGAEGIPTGYLVHVRDIGEQREAEETLRRSLEETTRSRRLVLALSRAAQAVQRARTTDQVFRTVGNEVTALGYQVTIFTVARDRVHVTVSYLTYDSTLVRAAEELTGLSARGYRFRLAPEGFLQRIIESGNAAFTRDDEQPFVETLPRPVRPLAGQLMHLLGTEESIVAPLTVGGEVYGLLAVTGAGLMATDVPAVTAFANQAAIAIENAQLLDAVSQQRRELERLSTQLINAQEEERGRISRELHDEIGQALTAMSINLAEVQRKLPLELGALGRERLAETSALVERTSEQVSALALDLRPSLLDDLGLVPTLRWYVDRYARRVGIQVELETVGLKERLPPEVATALYRVIQEALTNAARHAEARMVRLHLERKASTIAAVIQDDGKGFDVQTLTDRTAPEHGVGLVGMRERVALLGGKLDIESAPGQGTRISIDIPLG